MMWFGGLCGKMKTSVNTVRSETDFFSYLTCFFALRARQRTQSEKILKIGAKLYLLHLFDLDLFHLLNKSETTET